MLKKNLFLCQSTEEIEWETARPYTKIPGPNGILHIRQFLPGGKYNDASLLELNRGLRAEYGDIFRLKGNFRRKDFVFIFDPLDFEKVFRTEGVWPTRNGMESLRYFREHVRPDIFKESVGLVTE